MKNEVDVKIVSEPSKKFMDWAFPEVSNKEKLQITNTGSYSVTGKEGAYFISNLIIDYMKMYQSSGTNIIITDGTANNGSDTIMFGLLFKAVNAVEINTVNFGVLKNNISIYGLQNKVTLYNDSIIKILNDEKLKQDVLYLDPPWGGKDYIKKDNIRLYLDDIELSQIYLKYKDRIKLFVFKLPKNYDFNYFISVTKMHTIQIIPYVVRKVKLVFYIMLVKGD